MTAVTHPAVRGKLLFDEPMSKHTSWRLGGPADRYFIPEDLADLQTFLQSLDADTDVLWVGLGSNMLIRDGGFRGQVIAPLGALKACRQLEDGGLYAECGLSNSKFARLCRRFGLGGAEFFSGIPGTIGGALTMNAGAFGNETWNLVRQVKMINRRGELVERQRDEFEVRYRHVKVPTDEWFIAAVFDLPEADEAADTQMRELVQKRSQSQPIGLPSCGSVFKNPPGDHAARLIESVGLKGHCLGNACVSDKHANFIISSDKTLASEVEALIELIRNTVAEQHGVRLETEVRIVGEQG